jgi:hypothetical protein
MTFDLFGDLVPEEAPAPTPPRPPVAMPVPDDEAAHRAAWQAEHGHRMALPCLKPMHSVHDTQCRVGGGSACFSDDGGRTHFCMTHRPYGFLPSERFGHWLAKP